MSIIPIPNQPINLDPYVSDPCRTSYGDYCRKIALNSTEYFQFKQTTCGSDMITDGNFNSQSAEMIANGSFTGSAASWTLGAGWTYGSNKITCASGTSAAASQSGLTITANKTYKVLITISGQTSGQFNVGFNGDVFSQDSSGNQTYTFYLTATINNTVFVINPSSTFDGSVDDVSVKELASAWDVDSGWEYDLTGSTNADGMYCHIAGSTGDIQQTVAYISSGYYYVVFSVSDRSGGTLTISLAGTTLNYIAPGGASQAYINKNGTYTLYGYASTGGYLRFTADSDFDGCVSYASSFDLDSSFTYQLLNTDDSVAAIQPTAWNETIVFDRVIVGADMTGVPEGCYKIEVVDPCAATYAANVVPDPTIASPGSWTHTNEAGDDVTFQNVTIPTGAITMTVDGSTRVVSESYKQLVSGLTNGIYRLIFTIGHIDANLQHGGGNVINFYLGSTNYAVAMAAVAGSTTYTANIPVLSLTGTNDQVKVQFTRVNEGFCSGGEYIEVTSVYYQKVSGGTLVSNCFNITSDFDCEKEIIGICTEGYYNLGFYWDGNFSLRHWVTFLQFNPTYPIEASEYEYSTGSKSITFGRREKFKEGLTDYVDETTHDVLSTQELCDTFTIDGVAYYIKPDDYKPDWIERNGSLVTSQARFLLREKQSTIFKQNS